MKFYSQNEFFVVNSRSVDFYYMKQKVTLIKDRLIFAKFVDLDFHGVDKCVILTIDQDFTLNAYDSHALR